MTTHAPLAPSSATADVRRAQDRPVLRLLGPAVLVLMAIVAPLFRQRGNVSWESLWAEDGFLLLQQAIDGDALGQLFEGYAGYLVLVPRLLALPVAFVPVEQAPVFFALAGTTVCAVLAALTYRWSAAWIGSRGARLVVAALICLSPAAGFENTATLTNVIWAFAMVSPWALLAHRRSRWDLAARAAVLFGAVTSTALGLVFLPLAVACWWRRRDRPTTIVVVAYGVGVALQAAVMLVSDNLVVAEAQRPASDLVNLITVRVAGVFLLGPEQPAALWRDHGVEIGVAATLLVVVLFAVAVPGVARRSQAIATVFFVYGFAAFFAMVWARGTLPFRFGGFNIAAHMRYSLPATYFVSCAFACILAPAGAGRSGPVRRVGRWVYVGHAVILMVLCFPVVGYRGLGPSWPEHLDRVAPQCRGLDGADEVLVPQDVTPYWGVRTPCQDVVP